jgi:flagellin
MRIQNNVSALNAHRYYGINQTNTQKSIAKLSSGYRINSAADDAAGLAISEKMRAQIRGLTMASKNAQDGISLIQTAEGGLQEIDNMLQRIRELVVYASNDTQEYNTLGTDDRQKIQDEINQLTAEIDSMADRVEFNKKKLIDGSLSAGYVAGVSLDNRVRLAKAGLMTSVAALVDDITDGSGSVLGTLIENVSAAAAAVAPAGLTSAEQTLVSSVVGKINSALLDIVDKMYNLKPGYTKDGQNNDNDEAGDAFAMLIKELNDLGEGNGSVMKLLTEVEQVSNAGNAQVSALAASIRELASSLHSMDSATDLIDDIYAAATAYDSAYDAAVSDAGGVKGGGGDALYFQVGANSNQGMLMNIGSVKTDRLGIGNGNQNEGNIAQDSNSLLDVRKATGADITAYLDTLDEALSIVTTERSKLGAAQNRLEYTMSSLDISAENLTAAESRVRDVDMAKEMTNFTKQNVLFQASIAMLAQANSFPQGVLQLLG